MLSLLPKAATENCKSNSTEQARTLPNVACTILHHVPGRIRFRIPKLKGDSEYTSRLETLLTTDKIVKDFRLRKSAASLTIYYLTSEISKSEIDGRFWRWIQKANDPAINLTLPIQNQKIEPEWENLKLPALATVLATLSGVFGFPIPAIVVGGTVAAAALPVLQRAISSVREEKRFNIDCMDLMAISLSSFQGNLLTPALVMTLHQIGDIIRERTARNSHNQILDLSEALANFAWVERNGEKLQVAVAEVEVGETVIIYPGEQIPVDGTVLRGQAVVDQQKLTGESVPVVVTQAMPVFASTLVRSGEIYVKTERVGKDTRAGASIVLLQQAPVYDTRMDNYAAKIADKAILPALVLAGAVFATTGNPARAASILTLDFVTGLRVSIPTTFLAALTHATRHGVLIRSGRALEQLAQVDTIFFDKTGTLTQGDIAVVRVETVAGRMSPQQVLQLAASAEQRLTHPVAEAVVRHAELELVPLQTRGEWNYEVGLGVRAEIAGHQVLVGSPRFLTQESIEIDCLYAGHPCQPSSEHKNLNCPISSSTSLIYVACDGEFQGVLEYKDPLRPESKEVINQLQNNFALETHLLTGDNLPKAQAVAQELGIPFEAVHAEAFPEQKAEVVRKIHESGRTVAFVGDGLNDSVALAYADVSVSFGNGSQVARETADVVLMNNNLSDLLVAVTIAKQTMQVIKQNTLLAVAPNVAGLGFASTIGLHPLTATVVHNGSAIAAGLNGLRPLITHQLEGTVEPQPL